MAREKLTEGRIIGVLNNPGKRGLDAYRERAGIAARRGMILVDIEKNPENLERMKKENLLFCRYFKKGALLEAECKVPRVVYDRVDMLSPSRANAESLIKEFVERKVLFVNNPQFRGVCADKWKTYLLFNQNKLPIPECMLYTKENLTDMLMKYNFLFVKKRVSSQGNNQFTIRNDGNDFLIKYRNALGSVSEHNSKGLEEMFKVFSSNNIGEDYIIQKGIDVDKIDDRKYDLRTIFQRGKTGRISLTAWYLRLAALNSDQSNIGSGGEPHDPEVIIKDYSSLKERISFLGKKTIKALSTAYVIGEVGLDMVVGRDGEIYELEANSKPGTKGPRDLTEKITEEIKDKTKEDDKDKQEDKESTKPHFIYKNADRIKWASNVKNMIERPILYARYLHDSSV